MTDPKGISVIAAPLLDPAIGRIEMTMAAGATVDEIVVAALPGLLPADRMYCRVTLVSDRGSIVVPASAWARVRPHVGVRVIIRMIPGKDSLRSILQIVVSVAAIALGQYWAGPALLGLTGASAQFAAGVIALGVNVIGNLLINALIPPAKPDQQKAEARYTISGWRNRLEPDGAIPLVLGTVRYAPPFGMWSYSEIVGDLLYIRSVFCFGYGRTLTTGYQIGDTDLSEYNEVDIEVREGVSGDLPLTLVTKQLVEEAVGAELIMPYERDDLGEIISGVAAHEEPVVRTTGADASGASVILGWPGGMIRMDKKGKRQTHAVTVRIEQRRIDATDWSLVVKLVVSAKKLEAFYRQHSWNFPTRGRWQVRCVMMTPETSDTSIQQRTTWMALQTIRPEYPFNFPYPLALVALRIKSTHQLNGQLDNFNAVASRPCLDYDHATNTWIERVNSNPASLYRYVLQTVANPKRVGDAGIDLVALADWHDMCRLKGLKYDRVIDDKSSTLRDLLTEIAAAGRASPRHDGIRWSVTIDRPEKLVIDHINPRNSWDMRVTRSYVEPPDGFRVKFLDATNDHKPAERLVPWPGRVGPIVLTEELEMPGKTDPVEIFLESRRRMYEALYRPDIYTVSQDGPVSAATRGDRVRLSSDVINRVQVAARVSAVAGTLIALDESVTMVDGVSYAIRFIAGLTEEDTIGTSVIRTLVHRAGEHNAVTVNGDGPMPSAGDLIHFGEASVIDYDLVVTGVEAGDDFSRHLRLVDRSANIDTILDAEVVPAWSGRVGSEVGSAGLMPAEPLFTSIVSGVAGTSTAGRIEYLIEPGSGPVATMRFDVDYRLAGAGSWSTMSVAAASGGGAITGYINGASVQIRGRGIASDGTPGPYSVPITIVVGAGDATIPAALDASAITIGALLGGAVVQFSSGPDTGTTQVQIYRSQSAVLNRATDASGEPMVVAPSRSYSVPLGDATRENKLINGAMDNPSTWTLGTDWLIASGKASKAAGSAAALSQPLAASPGVYYRVSYDLSDVSAGDVTPRLTGGSVRAGTARAGNGSYVDRIQAVTGNVTFELLASADFVGSVDNVIVYFETSTCLPQGVHYFLLEPQNDDDVPGPIAGPFSVTIK